MSNINITVSIFMLTYNQEEFIEQTIESILIQRTNFDFQIVIGEDYSTDRTRDICTKYASEHGKKIKLLPCLSKNIGLIANYMRTIAECDGKYIAICDGDDYWIDSYKLQKQVDFLEKNPDYSIVYTALKKLYDDGKIVDYTYSLKKNKLDFNDLIFNNFIHSVTAMFRNFQSNGIILPSWINKFPFGDWQTYLWVLRDGSKIHFMADITAIYRMNIGVSSNYMRKNSAFIQLLLSVLKEVDTDKEFINKKEIITLSIINKKRELMLSLNQEKAYLNAYKIFILLLKTTTEKLPLTKLYFYSVYKSFC